MLLPTITNAFHEAINRGLVRALRGHAKKSIDKHNIEIKEYEDGRIKLTHKIFHKGYKSMLHENTSK